MDVSVVIPAYNAEGTIARTIKSVQELLDCQVFVIDDGSTDRTKAIAGDSGATVIAQANSGASAARKNGIGQVSSPYVILLDSDDYLDAGMLEAVREIDATGAAVVGGQAAIIGRDERIQRVTRQPRSEYSTGQLLEQPYSPWPPSCAVWRVSAIRDAQEVEPQPLGPRFAEDFELLIRVSLCGPVRSVRKITCHYAASGGKSVRNAEEAVRDSERVRKYYSNALGFHYSGLSNTGIKDQAKWRAFRAVQSDRGTTKSLAVLAREPANTVAIVRHHLRMVKLRSRIENNETRAN